MSILNKIFKPRKFADPVGPGKIPKKYLPKAEGGSK